MKLNGSTKKIFLWNYHWELLNSKVFKRCFNRSKVECIFTQLKDFCIKYFIPSRIITPTRMACQHFFIWEKSSLYYNHLENLITNNRLIDRQNIIQFQYYIINSKKNLPLHTYLKKSTINLFWILKWNS